MSEPAAQEAAPNPTAVTPPRAPARAPSNLWKWLLALAALAAAGVLATARLAEVKREQQGVRQRVEELTLQHLRDLAELREFEDRVVATAHRTEQLEQQLTELAGRDTAADADLRRLREEHVLAEVDQLLTLAASQLQIMHDPAAAISVLASADARLARLPRAQFSPLREALARDIERLRKAPSVDMTGIALRLDRLVQGVDSWPLLSDPTRRLAAVPAKPRAVEGAPQPGRFGRAGKEIGETLRDLVRIRDVEAPESLLLAADQQQLVREHLRVRLLNARQAMLIRSEVVFRSDLADCQALIGRYFDAGNPLVAAALSQLKALAATSVDAPPPTLEDSLAALRSARPSLP
jgi:uroporphyrin-3 C-methyltransferase